MSPRGAFRRLFAGDALHVVAALVLDALVVALAYGAALLLRFEGDVPRENAEFVALVVPFIALAFIGANLAFGVYRTVWTYGGIGDILTLFRPLVAVTAAVFLVSLLPEDRRLPISVILIAGALIFPGMAMVKMRTRLLARVPWAAVASHRLLIVGAGRTGQLLARELQNSPDLNYQPVGFVDDDPNSLHTRIHGLRVFGSLARLEDVIASREVDIVAIALEDASGERVRAIVAVCEVLDIPVRIVPAIDGWVRAPAAGDHLRDVTLEDLLGRDAVEVDFAACAASVQGKSVLVTGAAGSIGSELCRQLLQFGPRELHLLDNNETGLFDLSLELGQLATETAIRVAIADVANSDRLTAVFERARPEAIYHAAALKHVPLLEDHPSEAFRTNVLGTRNLALAAREFGSETFVLISTDKAVEPASVYGASKRLAELFVLALAKESEATAFTVVRFGNVMGSRGSVVPIFMRQIEQGGPVTVMDAGMERYFISIPEAVALVIQAASYRGRGAIYMLEMGEPVNIRDLAERVIRLRGLRPGHDIEVQFTGPRPGEKLKEDLRADFEESFATDHPKIVRLSAGLTVDEREIARLLDEMAAASADGEEVRRRLQLVIRRHGSPIAEEAAADREPFTTAPG